MRPEFMIEKNGKTMCVYAGLLDEAHQQGLSEIRTTLIQIPTAENGNVAICQSEVKTERGVFTGIGDASPVNVARAMVSCLIRMAETRAKARALRDAVNIGTVCAEELNPETGELTPVQPRPNTINQSSRPDPSEPDAMSQAVRTAQQPASHPAADVAATNSQKRLIERLAKEKGQRTPDCSRFTRSQASQEIARLQS